MRPSADEVLRSVSWSLDTYLLPEIEEPFAKSLALTVSNLVRHVLLRTEREGPALWAEIAELRSLLGQVVAWADRDKGFAETEADVAAALARSWRDPGEYPTVTSLRDEVTDLRWVLDRALRALQAVKPKWATDEGYLAVRREIRSYLRTQLTREAQYITEAFTGDRR